MRLGAGIVLAGAALWCVAGCGGDLKLVSVSGNVKHDGKPLDGAEVVFTPDASNQKGVPGGALTDSSGNYKALTDGRSGLVSGKYLVFVRKATGAAASGEDEILRRMAAPPLGATNPKAAGKTKAAVEKVASLPPEIKGEFKCEIPVSGGTQDFEIKGGATP